MLPLLEGVTTVVELDTGCVHKRALARFNAMVPSTVVQALFTMWAKGGRSRGSREGAPEGGVGGRERGGHHIYFVKAFGRPMVVVHRERVSVRRSVWRSDMHDVGVALRALLVLV